MTVVIRRPFTPIQQMKEVLRIWALSAQILDAIKKGNLSSDSFSPEFELRVDSDDLPFNIRLTKREYSRVARHSFYASTGLCALVFDEAMNLTYGKKSKDFPAENTGIVAARAIIYQIRNAFAHGFSRTKWEITNPNYTKKYRINELKVEADLTSLDGRDFSMRHLGGWIRFKALLTYCLERVEDRQRRMDSES